MKLAFHGRSHVTLQAHLCVTCKCFANEVWYLEIKVTGLTCVVCVFLFVRLEAFSHFHSSAKNKDLLIRAGSCVLLRADISLFPAGITSALRVFAESWEGRQPSCYWHFSGQITQSEEMPREPRVKGDEQKEPIVCLFLSPLGTSVVLILCHEGYRTGMRTLKKEDFFPREELKNIWDISELSLACESHFLK